MTVVYAKCFEEYLLRIKDSSIRKQIGKSIEKLEFAGSLREVTNIKAFIGYPGYYRLRSGDFRIGFYIENETTVRLLIVDHRSKIYREFPKNFA